VKRKLIRNILAGVTATAALVVAVGFAVPSGPTSDRTVAVADGTPAYAVEDFNYPQADKILAEQGILLKRGDGHIVLAECGSQEGLLQVWSRSNDSICGFVDL
jgi:hypothetical protein